MIALAAQLARKRSRVRLRRAARTLLETPRKPIQNRTQITAEACAVSPESFPLVSTGQGDFRRNIYPEQLR